jgi:hypothetical protein
MAESAGPGGPTWAQVVTDAINDTILQLVMRSSMGRIVKPYVDVAIIRYGGTVSSLWSGALSGRDCVSLPELADHPLRLLEKTDADGRWARRSEIRPHSPLGK